jgi:hypothetical protein
MSNDATGYVPPEGEKKMQLSIPVSMHQWIAEKIPFRGGNEFARQAIALGRELYERGLVQGFKIDTAAVIAALEAAGHKKAKSKAEGKAKR